MSLVVYKSSAGSGKTTTLVNEYLKIALPNPNDFRNILAITFTNKAAHEMKSRVIETLQGFSDKSLPISNKYNDILQVLDNNTEKLRTSSSRLLNLILHNYDDFAISTIDSFIHRIIRTFASDVELPQNFEVVIDDNDIIPDIIHNLYEKVGYDKELTRLLIGFVLSESDEENRYDPTEKLVGFIKHHMREDGFDYLKKIDNLTLSELTTIIEKIKKKLNQEKSEIISISNKAIELCNKHDLQHSDFYKGKNGLLSFFFKASDKKFDTEKLITLKTPATTVNEDRWFGSKANESTKNSITSIKEDLSNYYQKIIDCSVRHVFYKLVYSKIYSLALINEIKKLFEELTEASGKVHISEFNKKINEEISNQSAPYIYMRLGNKYKYFLIDEFQDTSVLQWNNLLPLIEESLSYSRFNMLVGDAKQAIYRFRSGEVELFTSLPKLYGRDNSTISLQQEDTLQREFLEKNLSTNWRSEREIIEFNNLFFSTISQKLGNRIQSIYSGVIQDIPDDRDGGLVSINFIDDDQNLYSENKHQKIFDIIQRVTSAGYGKKDICILCRATKKASEIAKFLINENIDVISSESLLVTNSPKVRAIIAFLQLLNDPDNEIAAAEFIENYLRVLNINTGFHKYFIEYRSGGGRGINKLLSIFDFNFNENDLLGLSVYEISEFILREIIRDNKADIFVQYFLDFVNDNKLPLFDFLARMSEKQNKLFITMPKDLDAVQIMTIHKAKGLDFPIVIADIENIKKTDKTKDEYWETVDIEDIPELKVALLPINNKLNLINKSDIYEEEVSKTELDYMNLVYVAFTRASNALFTVGRNSAKDRLSKYLMDFLNEQGILDEVKLTYEFGSLRTNPSQEYSTPQDIKMDIFTSSDWTKTIDIAVKQSLNSELTNGKSSRAYGKLIHFILSKIYYNTDLNSVLNSISDSAIFSGNEVEIIADIITNIVTNSELSKYFNERLIIKNETEIMLDNGDIIRPDRVVLDGDKVTIIDYKTGEQKKEDIEQIKGYQRSFALLGYKDINCKLVYIGDIIKIVDLDFVDEIEIS